MKTSGSVVKPSSREASVRLTHVRRIDTVAEIRLRRTLYARGLRYRLHVPLLAKPRRASDIVFRRKRLAIFVDGCFWHGCLKHGTSSNSNADFWRDKIETNKRRDLNTNKRLATAVWRVLRVWKHEDPEVGADRIVKALEFDA